MRTPARGSVGAMAHTKALVTGALGVVGRAVVERLATREGVRVVGLARRAPDAALVASLASAAARVEWLRCDLQDAAATRAALSAHRDVTHLVYAALYEQPELVRGWLTQDHVAVNAAMLANTLAALEGAPLAHVALLQGTKAYGVHTGRAMRVPARERDALRDHANFYFAQQDLLEARARERGFAWTIFRPQVVLGVALGSAMNPVAALGAYAVLQRELGEPLRHPGHAHLLTECTDARLVAAAIEWSWREPRANREALNVANGDVVVWRTLFERLADFFAMPLARGETPLGPLRLASEMPKHAELWRRVAQRESLRISDLDALIGLSWQYADATWAAPAPFPVPPLVSTIKARQLGFGDCIDSEECVVQHLAAMRALRYLPAR
ncbi:MAG TPA: NAD-dependent epimerase/dehydratase family protein [Myxococcota bacterium]|nr:NAD-dependent epimerase/dehydratase family protein [Myxococcota bacterium]